MRVGRSLWGGSVTTSDFILIIKKVGKGAVRLPKILVLIIGPERADLPEVVELVRATLGERVAGAFRPPYEHE